MTGFCDQLLRRLTDVTRAAKRWQTLEFAVACTTAAIVIGVTVAAAVGATTVAVATGVAGIATGALTVGLHQRTKYWQAEVLRSADFYDQRCELRRAWEAGVLPTANARTQARMLAEKPSREEAPPPGAVAVG